MNLLVHAGRNSSYIGKTERTLSSRLSEHSGPFKSSISKHVSECENANFVLQLNRLFDNLNDTYGSDADETNSPLSFHHHIQAKNQILQSLKYNNSYFLLFLEALYIKYRKPVLNNGLKASKEFSVFV